MFGKEAWEIPVSKAELCFHGEQSKSSICGASGKEPTCQCGKQTRCWFDPWVGKIPLRRARQPTPVFLPEESPGHRRLVGNSP